MIERYARSPMKDLWTEAAKYERWLQVELAVVHALDEFDLIPTESAQRIRERVHVDIDATQEIEAEIGHDLLSFVRSLENQVGSDGRYVHRGLTSYDVVDTGLSMAMCDGLDVLRAELDGALIVLQRRALEHESTVMIGRTHGVHAEPITFGLKLLNCYDELARDRERLKRARSIAAVGKLSGSVGTYANVDPEVERRVCEQLGLQPADVSSQLLARDRHAEVLSTLAITAGTLERIVTEIRNLSRTEIDEVREGRPHGSSSMPHKQNPSNCETVSGLARVVRSNALAGMQNMAVWHEQDLSRSSVERVAIPDSFQALHTMLSKTTSVLTHLQVNPERMRANLDMTRGAVFSQGVLLALVDAGMGRTEAHEHLTRAARESDRTDRSLLEVLRQDEDVVERIGSDRLEELFDVAYHAKRVGTIFDRFFPDR